MNYSTRFTILNFIAFLGINDKGFKYINLPSVCYLQRKGNICNSNVPYINNHNSIVLKKMFLLKDIL